MRNPNWSFTMTGASVALPACAPTSWRHGSSRRSLSLARGGGGHGPRRGCPLRAGKAPCGVSGTGTRATGWVTGAARPENVGDVWTWRAIDADAKLIIGWLVGDRDAGCASEFMNDVASRIHGRVQLTTDGHRAYLDAVDYAFAGAVDYAMLVKLYGDAPDPAGRYSPAKCIGTKREAISGDPDPEHVSTSYIERSNLTLRMANRRYTRLTNAFSRKLANHCHMVALYTVWYNFVKMHKSLKMTPALAANVTDTLWSMDDLVALVDQHDAAKPRQKPGRKQQGTY